MTFPAEKSPAAAARAVRVVLDGEIVPLAEARISVLDRGFLYGDSVYETARVYEGVPFALAEHLARLDRSAQLLGFALPRAPFASEVDRAVAALGDDGRSASVRIVVTRGIGEFGLDPALADRPTRVVLARAFSPLPAQDYENGVSVRLVEAGVLPGGGPGVVPAGAKTGNYLTNLMALREARRHDAHEAILVDAAGHVTEGSTSNVFLVEGGRLVTPPLAAGILPGITREKVLEIAARRAIPVEERAVTPEEIRGAGEVFLTSSTREVLPVSRADERAVGTGRAGLIARALLADYRVLVRDAIARAHGARR